MKTKNRKYAAFVSMIIMVLMLSCVKENPLDPNAEFKSDLTGNTAYANEPFNIYLDDVQGEFLTIFSGINETSRYNPEDPTVKGKVVDIEVDSFLVDFYSKAGKYRLTLVASSSGNWAEDYLVDTFGIDLTVIDRDIRLDFFEIDDERGIFSDDGSTINFYTHKNDDISAKVPVFQTSSDAAVVTVNGVVQVSKKSEVDFSALSPGDDVGRPVVYVVKSPSGETMEYTVQYILRDPSSEKQLLSFITPFGTFAPNEIKKEVKVIYPGDEDVTDVECEATGSLGAKIFVDDKDGEALDLAFRDYDVDLTTGVVTVEAEDLSTQDYDILLYPSEALATFKFTESGGTILNPEVEAVIEGTTLTLKVLSGTNLSSVKAEFTGISSNKLFLGNTELTSGVTTANYASNPVLTQKAADGTVLVTYTLVIEELAK